MTGDTVPPVVVMGVSASGKSSVGRAIADRLSVQFVDGDDLHPASNVAKMASGKPLVDADRWPWLDAVASRLSAGAVVVACSALKRAHRDLLRTAAPDTIFIHLKGSTTVLQARAAGRTGHFMPPSLLASQLATLEDLTEYERGFELDVSAPIERLVEESVYRIA